MPERSSLLDFGTEFPLAMQMNGRKPPMPRLSQSELANLNQNFEERTPLELIQWAYSIFGDRLATISAMQKSGCVISHMLKQLQLPTQILFVDTGVMFQETLQTRDRLNAEYGLNVRTLQPAMTMEEQTEKLGVLYLSVEGQKECCHARKVEPLLEVKGDYDCLIGSLRRADGGKRGDTPILGIDKEMNAIRINPLANMTDDELNGYVAENNVITNPLHEQGYATIGCNRCTTPVMPNEPKRAGRWRHLGPWSMYCGINPTDMFDPSELFVEFSQELIDRILGIETDFMI